MPLTPGGLRTSAQFLAKGSLLWLCGSVLHNCDYDGFFPPQPGQDDNGKNGSTMARKVSAILLAVLALFLIGTAIVLSATSHYLFIEDWAYITEVEVPITANRVNSTNPLLATEKVPRILHQTWKSETLPERWREPSQHCRDLMPD